MANVGTYKKKDLDSVELSVAAEHELKNLLDLSHDNLDQTDDEMVVKAFKLCYDSHKGVKRASGEPFYRHPVEVAKIMVTEFNIDDESVIASLLHDTVEDTTVSLADIRELFGVVVAQLIDGLTKITG